MTAINNSSSILKKSQLFSLLIMLVLSIQLQFAQNLKFQHYGLPEGLPQETIHCITKDSLGFYWLGTSDGVVRFDGINFKSLITNNEKDENLEGLLINDLKEDNLKNIWIATSQNGIYTYNYVNEKQQQIGITNSNATSIVCDKKGTVFVSYFKNGIYKFLKQGDRFKNKKLHFKNLNKKEITSLLLVENTVLFGTNSGELFLFNSQEQENVIIKKVETSFELGKINNLVLIDNTIWVCSAKGLFLLSNNLETLTSIPLHTITQKQENSFSVFDIVRKNNFYFIATNNGFLELLKTPKSHYFSLVKHYISKIKYDPKTPNNNVINDLFIDKNLLFLGANNLDVTEVSKNKILKLISKELNIGNPSIFSFLKHKQSFFVGTTSGLLFLENYFDSTKKNTIHKISLPKNRVRTMIIDDSSNLWVSGTNSIFVLPLHNFDPKNPQIETISPFKNKDGNTIIRRLYKDHLGTIWIATNGDGLYRFTGNIDTNEISFKKYQPNDSKNSLPSGFIIGINQDNQNNYWLSTQTGLCKMSFDDNTYKNPKYTNFFQGENGLKTNGTLSTFLDSDNQLWIATRKGLQVFENEKIVHYGKSEGLSNTFVYNILEDNIGNLWLSTNGGLFRFNKNTKTFSNYTKKDGLQSSEFNLGAAFKDNGTGELYFGGINGINYFQPSEIDKLDKEGDLLFTNFSIKDKEIVPSSESKYLQQNISLTKKVQINHDDFPVNLSFSALDFRPNSNNQYVYKLLPDDKQWNPLNDKNSIQLLTLSPKAYTLQIQGMSRGKLWSKAPLQLSLNVKPPWYRSNLAYLTYLALFLALVYVYYKIMLQRKLAGQETKRLQELDDLKSRFITNITHEFRTPLTIILGYLGNLKEQFSGKKDTLSSLNTIEKNSNNLLSLVNQMLDLAKLEQGSLNLNLIQNDIVEYINHLVHSFSSIANDKNIKLQFNPSVKTLQMDFDPEKIRQIFTNLISNALKFSSENTEISITLQVNNKQLEIGVSDEGYGISGQELSQIFDRFYQVNNQDFKVSQGTGIGLALTKELVELMKGSISVTSKINEGTIFKVILPIAQKALVKSVEVKIEQASIGETAVPKLENTINLDDTNTVLIVEDNKDMARYIASCLQHEYKIITAENGKQGLEVALVEIPDLILTDVMMPIMDGYELTQKLQEHDLTNHIPIIMLTSKAMQEDKIEGLTRGADAYLTKPFSKKELLLRIEKLIAKRKLLQEKYQVNSIVKKVATKKKINDKNELFLNTIITCVHKHLDDTDFNAPSLAQELTMSDSQLYRKLKAISNTSTAVFIRKVRLEKAKELLQTTDLTVSEIVYSTGFSDPSWFSKVFKEEFNQSPTDFRK
ncbi:response regulator [Psychroserpens sp.]